MSEIGVDPLRFLNIKKKRQSNKQRTDLKISQIQSPTTQQVSRFILPSFSSQNSLENGQRCKVRKQYDPLKYFNPQIQAYLNKIKTVDFANLPVMPPLAQEQEKYKEKEKETEKEKEKELRMGGIREMRGEERDVGGLGQEQRSIRGACRNEAIGNQMMTFSKGMDKFSISSSTQQPIPLLNRPGLKKSGSCKMMEKLQENPTLKATASNEETINPWMLSENIEDQDQQLQECQVCNRKFNPQSYVKHVRVCQKVFFQKRKPFNSREVSLQKKIDK